MKKKPIDDKKENKRPFFYSQFYDASDIEAASKNAYNTEMSSRSEEHTSELQSRE